MAHRHGILSHASLMVAGPAAADAVARARRCPALKVGLHLVVIEGAAALPHSSIPDLVDASGHFPADQVSMGARYFFRPNTRQQLRAEIRAQFAAFAATGLTLAHADAHKHMHLHPTIGGMLIQEGSQFGLPAIRVPAEPPDVLARCGHPTGVSGRALYHWTALLRGQVRRAGMQANDHVFGIAWSGHMTAGRVLRLSKHLPPGASEIYFHPATHADAAILATMPGYDHAGELSALLDPAVATALAPFGVARTHVT